MPKPLQYNSKSLIYRRGEESDKVFILQSGQVSLVCEDIETGENMKETVLPGEFFGVRSALGHYPREENALILSEGAVSAFTVPEFELYALSDTKIILNLLKAFSSHLRQIYTRIAVMEEPVKLSPDEGLFGIGEKYLKNGRNSHAKYIFTRYLALYPEGKNADKAAKNLHLAEISLAQNAQRAEKTSDKFNAAKAYYNAVNLIKTEKYRDAMRIFIEVADSEDPNWAPKGVYEVGHCLLLLNRFEDCITHYQDMFTQFPKHPDKKDAMFYVGQAFEKMDKKEIAADWYKKILDLPSADGDKTRAKTIQALEALGG